MSREERRRGSRRVRIRISSDKTDKLLRMREQGRTRPTMARALGLRESVIDELEAIASEGEGVKANNA